MNSNILTKVNKLESLIKEIRNNLNSHKVKNESKYERKEKKCESCCQNK
jgi:hypothetical protein